MLVNLRAGSTRQGGSTITQQVVKNLLLNSRERTFTRKIREALLSRRLEQELSKDEILELYLNDVYFGRGRYGIEEAARDDFGKSATDLTIGEAALIAGRIANPHGFHPRTSIKAALTRRAYVLDQMHAKGFLGDAQWEAASNENVNLAPAVDPSASELAPEAVEMARGLLYALEPDLAHLGGFTITDVDRPHVAGRGAQKRSRCPHGLRQATGGARCTQATAGDGGEQHGCGAREADAKRESFRARGPGSLRRDPQFRPTSSPRRRRGRHGRRRHDFRRTRWIGDRRGAPGRFRALQSRQAHAQRVRPRRIARVLRQPLAGAPRRLPACKGCP